MRIPIVVQMRSGENGAAALGMMLGYYGKFVPMEELREVCVSSRNGSSPEQMMDAAAGYGLEAKMETPSAPELRNMKLPLLVSWRRRYWCVVTSIYRDIISIADPARGEIRMTMEKFAQLYNGTVIVLEKGPDFVEDGKRESLYSLIRERTEQLRGPMLVLVILTLLCIFLNIGMVNIQKNILDTYMKPGSMQGTNEGYLVLSLYIAALSAYFLFSLAKTRLINSSSRNLSAISGSRLFKKMFDQPLKFFEQYSAGELMARIDNNISLDNSIMRSLVPRTIDAVMTVVYLLTLMKYNLLMAVACFAAILVSLTATLYIQEKNAIASRSMTTSGNMLSTTILNGMSMIDTIKSTGSERSFYNMWRESMTQANEGKLRTQYISAALSFVSGVQGSVLQGIQLFLGAYFVLHGNFTLGSMALFQGILNNMLSSLNNCMTSVNTLQTMRTNIERVNDIMNRESRRYIPLPESERETADKLQGHLVASHVTYRYNQADSPAVDDVSMEVKPGQMVAIVGKTGSGKSTMLKILADLYKAESGEILYSGRPRDEIPDVIFHSSVMTVDQDIMMFEDSVYNNIRMWDTTIENYEVILAARDAQIHDRILNNRKDYGSMIEENGRNYSGGELQRLELARALAHEPTLLFLDEFTSALDALTEDRVIKSIRDKGTTCIIVAHRLSTIVDCDRIYVMDGGKVVQEGTHEELYAQGGLYRDLIKS
ncbi:MAG: ATP-binding cassette domain-containing protein [Lachnospiraceae bacterium]|nr:ATP-binding cassette domain-containing protein [Lachnospiraceae bacterium]